MRPTTYLVLFVSDTGDDTYWRLREAWKKQSEQRRVSREWIPGLYDGPPSRTLAWRRRRGYVSFNRSHGCRILRQYAQRHWGTSGAIQRADIILADSVYPCGNLVAAKYSLPLVVVARRLFNGYLFGYGIPNPPSYVPGQNHPSAEVTGFLQRARNILSYRERYNWAGLICPTFNEQKTKFNIAPHESIAETLSRVDLILVQLDFPIEVPRPLLPSKSWTVSYVLDWRTSHQPVKPLIRRQPLVTQRLIHLFFSHTLLRERLLHSVMTVLIPTVCAPPIE